MTTLRKTILLAALVAVGLFAAAVDRAGAVVAAGSAAAAADPLTCAGYPEKRVFLESQGWWGPMPVTGRVGHVHLATCFPHAQTVTGVITLDVRVMLHDNDGVANQLRLAIGSSVVTTQAISMSCEASADSARRTCAFLRKASSARFESSPCAETGNEKSESATTQAVRRNGIAGGRG